MEVDDGEDYEDKALSSRGETGDPSASDDLGGSHALKPATATKGSTTSVDDNDETLGKETSGKQPPLAREQTTTSVEVDGSDEDETPGTATPKVTKERPASFGFSMDVDDGEDKEDKALSSRGETGDASGRAPRSSVLDDFITGKGGSGSLAGGSKASEAATSTVGITAKGGSGSLVTSGDEEEEAKASFEDDTRQPASRLATWKDLGGPPSKVSETGGVPGSLATSGALGEEASSEDEAEASKKPPSRSLPSAEASKFASGTATLTIPEGVTVRKQQKNSKASDAATATEASTTGDDEEEEAKASEDEAGKPEAATAKPNSRPEKSKPRKKHKKGNDQKKRDRTREEITHDEDRQRRIGLQNEKERLKKELGKVSLDQDRRKEIITRIAQIDSFLNENQQNLWTDPNRTDQNSVTGIPWPEPLQDYREHGGNHTFMDLHHAAHLTGGKAWRINGDNCLLEAGCNAIGVRSALTVSDMCKAFETEKKCKPKNGEWKQHEHLFVVAMQQKFKIYNAITRSKKRKDKDRFPMLRSFYQLFNEKQGCFLVVVRMKVNSDSGFNNVGHCFMFNAGAGYIADGNEGVLPIKPFKEEQKEKFDCIARTEAEEQLRKTLSGRELQDFEDKLSKELDQKLAKQFGWSKLETVYQVVVKKDAVERGLVHQQIMPKDMGAQTTESGEGKK
ncbi:expressed unknown protein [Seminavis robusta]|uniref:Uncharacterized protein n=1 Tax=Seminavis robusta TaxID=568900 RepID=A0A9N8H304_9STRA|nr:expressed unknown protein [Seminavis robusta]|eukprot:Sro18_g012710.1 n/a (680) ;mRNA; f:21872-23987